MRRERTNRERAEWIADWRAKDDPWRDPLVFLITRALDEAEARGRAAGVRVCDDVMAELERLPAGCDRLGRSLRIIEAREIKRRILEEKTNER